MQGLFDLNIEQVLENWSIADALREIIANALDEQTLTGSQAIEIYKKGDAWHIRDYGRGRRYIHFTQNENDEKLSSDKLIGKFGVGLKDALAVLHRRRCTVAIRSRHNLVTVEMAPKSGFGINTLHANFKPPVDPEMTGTDFTVSGISDEDMEEAKSRFLVFNHLELLESTRYGEIYAHSNGEAAIYINGVKVANENNFMFSYNITSINAAIRKALNRERSNVGRTAYSDTVKNMLKNCRSDAVLTTLVDDLQNRMSGRNKDETAWVDVATHAAKTLNQSGNVVFMTPYQRADLTNQQVEILEESGKRLFMVTDDVYGKIENAVSTFRDVYEQYNNSFQYSFVDYLELSPQERQTFDLRTIIIASLIPKFRVVSDIRVSEKIRVDEHGDSTNGVWDGSKVIIKRSVLSDPTKFCAALAHELSHAQYGHSDNTRAFENDLTNMLGHFIYRSIVQTTKVNPPIEEKPVLSAPPRPTAPPKPIAAPQPTAPLRPLTAPRPIAPPQPITAPRPKPAPQPIESTQLTEEPPMALEYPPLSKILRDKWNSFKNRIFKR